MPVEKVTRCPSCGGRGKDLNSKTCVLCKGAGEVSVYPAKKKPSSGPRPKSVVS